jgi:hypothetical protein
MQIVTQNDSRGDFVELVSRATARSGFSGDVLGKGLFRIPTAQTLIDQFHGNSQIGSNTLGKSGSLLSHFAAGTVKTQRPTDHDGCDVVFAAQAPQTGEIVPSI